MSQNFSDPYQPPTMQVGAAGPVGADVDLFRNVSFWQRFFSILGYIASGLFLLVMLFQVGVAAMNGVAAAIGGLIGLVFALAIGALVYFLPAMLLGGAAKATKDFGEGRISTTDYAMQQQKFWRYCGIMVSIVMVIYFVLIVGFLLIGLSVATFR